VTNCIIKQQGYSQDSRQDAEFDLTDVLAGKCGQRVALSLRVMRFCDGSYMEVRVWWVVRGVWVCFGVCDVK